MTLSGFGQAQQGWEDCGCQEDQTGKQVLLLKLIITSSNLRIIVAIFVSHAYRVLTIRIWLIFDFRAEAKDGINRTALREIKLLQEVQLITLLKNL